MVPQQGGGGPRKQIKKVCANSAKLQKASNRGDKSSGAPEAGKPRTIQKASNRRQRSPRGRQTQDNTEGIKQRL